jgi:hypothetical protein
MPGLLKLGALALLVTATTATVPGQAQKRTGRLATTENLMVGMVHPNYLAIEDACKKAKVDPQAWKTLATNAALLNEAGYLLVDDERSLGKDWDNAAEELRTTTAAMLVQIDAHDMRGVATEIKAVGAACVRCHAAHRNR